MKLLANILTNISTVIGNLVGHMGQTIGRSIVIKIHNKCDICSGPMHTAYTKPNKPYSIICRKCWKNLPPT